MSWTIMTTTSGVIMTTTHQLVRPLTMPHSDESMSETPKAPEMNDHIHEAMLSRMPAM
jgi:hypothetical protein